MTGHDLSGSWRGHYEQHGGRHGISMQVAQRGQSFVGRMRDHDTLLSSSVDVTVVDDSGAAVGTVGCDTMGVLPEFSIVEGTVEHGRVTFDKRYQGTHTVVMWDEDGDAIQHELTGHRVRYEGRLDAAGQSLRGEWRIAPPEDADDPDGEPPTDLVGAFVLHRQ